MAPYLTPWRWAAAAVLVLVVGGPLLLPMVDLARQGSAGWTAADTQRLSRLFVNTSLLVAGTLAMAIPVGTALAVVLFRSECPGRRVLIGLTLLMLFVPLPMITSAWQGLFGSDGWLNWAWWGANASRPWTTGMGPAIWVHFLAGLPWVIVFVGLGLTWVERELEEDGLLLGPPLWVLWHITLPRCRGTLVFAAVWLALQVAGEISVTDMMLVSTYAEEVQTQFTLGDRGGVARSVVAALPLAAATWALLAWYLPRLQALPPLQAFLAPPRPFNLRAWRWPIAVVSAAVMLAAFAAPLGILQWKLGQTGHPTHWQASTAWSHLSNSWHSTDRNTVWRGLLTVAGAGAFVSMYALLLCWLAEGSRWLRRLMIGLLALAWAMPGPIIGIGMKDMIAWFPRGVLADLFYFRPSPLPLAWAYVVRFLPFAVAMLWPVVRLVPREPCEAARLEGAGPWREFCTVVWPLTRRGALLCGVLVAALSLGEVAASIRVSTPDWDSFAKLLFDKMHYGVTNDVAALSLVLLIAIGVVGSIALLVVNIANSLRPPIEARNRDANSSHLRS